MTCIINERITELNDGFTLVSHRGTGLVHYMITAHKNLHNVEEFNVINIYDLNIKSGLKNSFWQNFGPKHIIMQAKCELPSLGFMETETKHKRKVDMGNGP